MKWLLALTVVALCWLEDASTLRGQVNGPPLDDHAPPSGWKLADLESTMKSLRGRSYRNGQRMFKRAYCSKCHRLDHAGVEFGPDLAKLDLRFQPIDILRDILDPSRRIADARYDLWIFETDSGRVVSGLVRKQTEQTVEVMEKPPSEAPPVVIQKSEIERRSMSLGSMMPRGMLNQFSRDEIADLVAYVAARGDPSDPLVRPPVPIDFVEDVDVTGAGSTADARWARGADHWIAGNHGWCGIRRPWRPVRGRRRAGLKCLRKTPIP
ncbi:MAG TPA: hypothetical protein VMV69_03315 [Pirellulales bacterium]|nr:hypothetical protein [Pirellulales bacterium]